MMWGKSQLTQDKEELQVTPGAIISVPVGPVSHGDAHMHSTKKLPRIENSKPEQEDMENERANSEGDSEEDNTADQQDDHQNDDPSTYFEAVPGKSPPGRRGIKGIQPTPVRSRRSRFSLAATKRPRYPPRNDWPTMESGADVTI